MNGWNWIEFRAIKETISSCISLVPDSIHETLLNYLSNHSYDRSFRWLRSVRSPLRPALIMPRHTATLYLHAISSVAVLVVVRSLVVSSPPSPHRDRRWPRGSRQVRRSGTRLSTAGQ